MCSPIIIQSCYILHAGYPWDNNTIYPPPLHHTLQVTGRQWMAVFATIHLSAVIHEYIVAIALQFAFPLLFLEFAIGGGTVYNSVGSGL